MAEYIEREAALEVTCHNCSEKNICGGDCYDTDSIRSIPSADVQPVRHGRWRLLTNEEMRNRGPCGFLWASNSWMNYECSECGEMVHNELKGRGDSRTNYCHNCGAKMDGGD